MPNHHVTAAGYEWGHLAVLLVAFALCCLTELSEAAPCGDCGESGPLLRRAIRPQIVGGQESVRSAWPWMAALVKKDASPFYGQFCGGVLIHPYWVLTAAHCVVDSNPEEIAVLIGVHHLVNDHPDQYARAEVAEIFIHPFFLTEAGADAEADLALIRLKTPMTGAPVLPLLRDRRLVSRDRIVKVLGWGLTQDQGPRSKVLREVDVPIVPRKVADATGNFGGPLLPDMIAAGFAEGGKDSCQGDSGGPLLIRDPDTGNWGLAGLVSSGGLPGCAQPNSYGLYVDVSFYGNWVMGRLHPGFSFWAAAHGVDQLSDDPDRDGRPNLVEYALNSDPNLAESFALPEFVFTRSEGRQFPAIQFQRRASHDLAFRVEVSFDLKLWTEIDLQPNAVEMTSPGSDIERVIIRSPVAIDAVPTQFLRTRVETPQDLSSTGFISGRHFRLRGALDESRGQTADGHFREFRLRPFKENTELEFQFEALKQQFRPVLTILDDTTGDVLSKATAAPGTGGVIHRFTARAGITYRLRLASVEPQAAGSYRFNFPPLHAEFNYSRHAGLMIDPSDVVKAELTEEDIRDASAQIFGHFYELGGIFPGDWVTVTAESASPGGFAPAIVILNAETDDLIETSAFDLSAAASVSFRAQEGVTYLAAIENSDERLGTYQLQVSVEAGARGPVPGDPFYDGPIQPGKIVEGEFAEDDLTDSPDALYAGVYDLVGVAPGSRVTVTLQMLDSRTLLLPPVIVVVDGETGALIAESGFGSTGRATVSFTYDETRTAWPLIMAMSADLGHYRLSVASVRSSN